VHLEVKTLWTAALRSDKYLQGGQRLTISAETSTDGKEKDCCLGVLCKLAVEAGIARRENDPDGFVTYVTGSKKDGDYDSATGILPGGVMEWAGLEAVNPTIWWHMERRSLADLNDSGAYDFSKIADIIEECL
jgi:hypothetical protein